jgi:putative endonuclease
MFYVYVLQSEHTPERFYVGYTTDLKSRFSEHNAGKSIHTNKYKPWILRTYMGFNDPERARAFETYLKTSSGRAFMTKRF